jgi:peptide/nickel transport system substrate-binding protein
MNHNDKYKKLLVILLSILVFSSITGCINQSDNGDDNAPSRNSLIIGTTAPVFCFHPWLESYDTATMNINMNIFNSLVEFDQIFRTKPKLATSWNNPNNLTWRFYLRENVKFHNGYNFTSEDVKYTIDLIKRNESNALRDLLVSVKEVKIVNDYTVDIITQRPCPILLNKLVDIPIASKKYQEETTEKWPIGTGAYKLIKYVPYEYVNLERFDDYWDGPLEVKNVTFKVIEDEEEMKNALIAGEIDIAEHILPMYCEEVSESQGVTVERCNYPTVIFLSFDFRENDSVAFKGEKNPLTDIRVRKAIYYAINITDIIDNVLNGSDFAEPASQFVSPLIFGYNPNIERLPHDPEKAKELMKEAGYEEGFGLVLDCSNDSYNLKRICELLQTQLSEIIDVKLNFLPIGDFFMKIMSRNSSFYIIGWLAGTGDGGEIFDYMIRTVDIEAGVGTYNLGYYSNPEIDSIAENISHILDPEDRLDLMQVGFKIAMDDVAWIPLYVPKCTYGIADYVAWDPGPGMSITVEEIGFK